MEKKYYKLPLRLGALLKGEIQQLERCTEAESIDQHIKLLLTTCPGEHHFDENYGCRVWELDFGRVESAEKWKALLISYVVEAVNSYEPRLTDVFVNVELCEVTVDEVMGNQSIRRRADIIVGGVLKSEGMSCRFGYKLYLGPLSTE